MTALRYFSATAILLASLSLSVAEAVSSRQNASQVATSAQSDGFAAFRLDRADALTQVPESASLVLLGGGLTALAAIAKRRKA